MAILLSVFIPITASAQELDTVDWYNPETIAYTYYPEDGMYADPTVLTNVGVPGQNSGGWNTYVAEGNYARNQIEELRTERSLRAGDYAKITIAGLYDTSIETDYSFPRVAYRFDVPNYDPSVPVKVSESVTAVLVTGYPNSDVVEYHSYTWTVTSSYGDIDWSELITEAEDTLRITGELYLGEEVLALTEIAFVFIPYYESTGDPAPVDLEVTITYPLMTRALLRYLNTSIRLQESFNDGLQAGSEGVTVQSHTLNESTGEVTVTLSNGKKTSFFVPVGGTIDDKFTGIDWFLNIGDAILDFQLIRFSDTLAITVGNIIGVALGVPLLIWFLKLFAGG